MEYNFREIEKKWQQRWVERKTYKVVEDESKKKFYVLNMFPLFYKYALKFPPTSIDLFQ